MRPFQNLHIGLVAILLAAVAVSASRAAEVLLESGAVDDYDAPAMPECPDGQESAVGRRSKAVAEEEAVPPAVPPVSVHQAEQEFYDQFGAETEEEWNELKGELGEEPIAAPPKFKPLKASSAGPFTLQKEVFGWHPYWEGSGYTNYSFDLLSTIAYFSYEVDPNTGYATTMNSWSNTPLVQWAHSNGVDVVLCATLFSGHSTFFGSAAAQSNLINELIRVVQLRDADGVNIDFEGIPGGYESALTAFMSNLAARMHASVAGSQVSICLPAVDWSGNYDVAALDGFLDLCIMMGYDYSWGTDTQAGPVAPLKTSAVFGSLSVGKSVSNYLAAGLSPGKLLLGVPYYGYDWPTVSHALHADTTGSGTSRTYPNAKSYAATYGYHWDTNSLTPYVLYGSYRQLWYDDTNSLALKYDFANAKNLGGIGIWALGYDDAEPDLWNLLAAKFATTGSAAAVAEEGWLAVTPPPSGALSNIVVFCSAGHGFTANTNSGGWYVGRTLTNGVVEDMGNIDQLTPFAQYCLNAGAAVVPFRPVGYQTNQVILDNDDAGVTYTGTWNNSASTIFYGGAGDTPYRYAYISTNGATAGARFRPTLPAAGFYPVYAWALHSANRVRQLYRIRHSGGLSDIRVNHRRVGAGWVWLGTYHFDAGTNGWVEVLNDAPGNDPGTHVVIADAVRFGNGTGEIDRGWGVSGYEKELEASRYWVQGMTGQGMAADLYDRPTLNDSDDNVGAPTRMSDYMDNEADGDFWDRLYLGFHSNADGGAGASRGPMGLYSTANSAGYQALQQEFAAALAAEITNDFAYLDNGVGFNDGWANNSADIYGATYGELSETYNSNMNSTIIEVAYHNNVDDARLLRDPAARLYFARSCLKGMIRHLNDHNASVPLAFPPDPPRAPRAVNTATGVVVSWAAPATNTASGGAAAGYRVYVSTNGYGFGTPTATTNTSVTLTNLAAGATCFFRVTARNAGGESLPSEVVGARVAPGGRAYHLVVNGFDRFDRQLCPTRYFGANISGSVTMVRPRQVNSFDYVVQHGQALAAAGREFDACSHVAVASNTVPLTNYHAAYWILGEESTTNETFSSAEQTLVQGFLTNGGRLLVSGAELAWDLDYLGSSGDRAFLTNVLRASYAADSGGTNVVTGRSGTIFDGLGAVQFDNGAGDTYRVEYPDVFRSQAGSVTAMVYGASASGSLGAAIQFSNAWRVVVLGFPFETIMDASQRTNVMKRVADFFGPAPGEDLDADGMPDTWELLQFTNGTAATATGDADGDGARNWEEWVAGTEPTNAASAFSVEWPAVPTNGAAVVLVWPSVSSRVYALSWSTNLLGAFNVLSNRIAATPPENVYTDATHAAERTLFYRVSVTNE